jgi:hypothetical protein
MTAPRQYEARAGFDLRLLRATVFTVACVVLSAAGHSLASGATVPVWSLAVGCLALFCVAVPLAGRSRSLGGITALLAVGQLALHALFGIGQHGMTMPHSRPETSLMTHAARLMSSTHAMGMMPGGDRKMLHGGGAGGTGMGAGAGVGSGMVADGGVAAGHGMAAGAGVPGGTVDGSAPLLHALPMLPSLPMLLGHLLAAVVAGWLLRRGDLAVFRLVALSVQGVAEAALVRALRAALVLVRALRSGLPGVRTVGPRPWRTPDTLPAPPRTVALQHTVIRRGPPPAACTLAA